MAYLNTHARTTKPTSNDAMQPMGRVTLMNGVYVGFVKDASDVQRNGRLRVWIPEMASAPDNSEGWVIVNYCSPFAGATNIDTNNVSDVQTFEGTQTSYGMWMIPPDINNQVLVMFINGDPSRGIWIGCLYNQFMNNMVPGMAASTNNYQYPGKNIPIAEYNKNDPKVQKPDETLHPYEATKFKGLGNQGLLSDNVRGVTNSSARRESPSKVFGIITPGPVIDPTTEFTSPGNIRRKGGSSFIMDDSSTSEYIQLATKSGAQININETTGFIYLINRDGTAWVQMDKSGNIDIFGATNISMRAQQDINMRADRNINIEAGQNIFMKAAKDTTQGTAPFTYNVNNTPSTASLTTYNYVGEGNGTGGNIVMQALNDWQTTIQNSALLTVSQNDLNINVGNSLAVTTKNGSQNFNSSKSVNVTTNGTINISATGNIRAESQGTANLIGMTGIVLCTDKDINLNSGNNIVSTAASTISMATVTVDITGDVTVSSDINVPGNVNTGALNISSPTAPPVLNPAIAESPLLASVALVAEVKPLNDKINILTTWQTTQSYPTFNPNIIYKQGNIVTYNNSLYIANKSLSAPTQFTTVNWDVYIPYDKFKRQAQAVQTTVSSLPTFEPCPEHDAFTTSVVSGYKPIITADDASYSGSGSAGSIASSQPSMSVNPGANNTTIQGDSTNDSSITKDINMNALRCQLSLHEGIKTISYSDTRNLVTGGIGHLMRSNEISQYPVGTPISATQIESWYIQDATSAVKIAQDIFSNSWSDLSDIRKRAVTDLAYNMGKGGLSKFVNFIAAMNSQDFNRASIALQSSAWFNQVGRRGPDIVTMISQNIDPNGCDRKYPAQM